MSVNYQQAKSSEPATPPNAVPAYPPATARSQLPIAIAFIATACAVATLLLQWRYRMLPHSDLHDDQLDKLAIQPDRLAVCYSGHVGTLAEVHQQNVDNIRSFDADASFFYHLSLTDDYYDEKSASHYTRTHQLDQLSAVFDYAKATRVQTYTSDDIDFPRTTDCHQRASETREHYSHNFEHFFTAAQCYQMVRHAERERGVRFGWILHLRPDMNIAVKKPPIDVKPRVHLSGAAMALIPRQMADVFFSAVDVFYGKRCLELDAMQDEPCREYSYDDLSTECLLIKWLKRAQIVPSNSVYVNRKIIYPPDVQ